MPAPEDVSVRVGGGDEGVAGCTGRVAEHDVPFLEVEGVDESFLALPEQTGVCGFDAGWDINAGHGFTVASDLGVEAVEAGLFDNIAVGGFRGIEANGIRSFFSGFVAGGGQQQGGAYEEGKDPMREKGCFHE